MPTNIVGNTLHTHVEDKLYIHILHPALRSPSLFTPARFLSQALPLPATPRDKASERRLPHFLGNNGPALAVGHVPPSLFIRPSSIYSFAFLSACFSTSLFSSRPIILLFFWIFFRCILCLRNLTIPSLSAAAHQAASSPGAYLKIPTIWRFFLNPARTIPLAAKAQMRWRSGMPALFYARPCANFNPVHDW